MVYYIRNLMIALFGSNPYQMELEEVKTKYEKTAARVQQLEELRFAFEARMDSTEKMVATYQTLVENLRRRIAEKDELIHQMEAMASGSQPVAAPQH